MYFHYRWFFRTDVTNIDKISIELIVWFFSLFNLLPPLEEIVVLHGEYIEYIQ